MKNMFQFVTNKKEYTLYFQDAEYTKNDFERFYLNVNVMGKEVEFLPGIFYKFDIKHSFPANSGQTVRPFRNKRCSYSDVTVHLF